MVRIQATYISVVSTADIELSEVLVPGLGQL